MLIADRLVEPTVGSLSLSPDRGCHRLNGSVLFSGLPSFPDTFLYEYHVEPAVHRMDRTGPISRCTRNLCVLSLLERSFSCAGCHFQLRYQADASWLSDRLHSLRLTFVAFIKRTFTNLLRPEAKGKTQTSRTNITKYTKRIPTQPEEPKHVLS